MTEETQATETGEAVVEEVEKVEDLDSIISEYNVKSPPSEMQAPAHQPQYSPPQPSMKVDPLDEDQFNDYAKQVERQQSVLSNQVTELSNKLTQIEQKEAELRIETDIQKAVESIGEGLSLNPKLLRVHLEYTAQEKPGFKKIWENRYQDPQTYARALNAIKKEVSNTYSVRQDPSLTETQKAIQTSQQSLASRSASDERPPVEQALANAKDPVEFNRLWQSMVHGQ